MPFTFLCAGCSPDERDAAEATAKAALGDRTRQEGWIVSLVKVGANWSVTLDGPGHRALSFVAPEASLRDAIRERLAGPAPGSEPAAPAPVRPSSPASPPVPSLGSKQDRHECRNCRRAFLVIYEVQDDEDQEMVSIACPHCWQKNHVLIAEAAAYTQAFRAEKLDA